MALIANISENLKCNGAAFAALLVLAAAVAAPASADSTAVVRHRGAPVVTFTAQIAGDHLVITAELEPGWHIYAMDNVERARQKTGNEAPECELPTRFAVDGPVKLTGAWRQSAPADLSDPDIYWYTWGFKERAVFAVPVEAPGDGPVRVTINGQACNESSCSMLEDVALTAERVSEAPAFDYSSLTPLETAPQG